MPQPQATVGGRDQWARAVADDWVEARRRSREGVRTVMSAGDRDELSRGAAEVRDHFAADFHGTLWERPDVRKRWVLRARNEGSVREVSDALTWTVAVSLDRILPTEFLGSTVVDAVLHSFADAVEMDCNKESREGSGPGEEKVWMLYVSRSVAAMLDWFIRHHPESAHHYIGEIMHAAHRQWEIPAEETVRTLCTAVSMDGKMSDEDRKTFFALLAPPAKTA
ncbi:hypothetical protein ACIQNK_37815 [Streptomyces sp. NPDC091273]|uniref:hypothetical protein n=1 Tax=Streptomyces sp. NPDC091273 TaxID=3365982 RepID=UPI00382478C6